VLVSPLAGTTGSADLCYDEQAHHQFMHLALNRLLPAELGAWLDDEQATRVSNAPHATFVESYRTWQTNPLADGLRGSLLSRVALAALVFCGFTPVIRCGQEDADREFIQRLLAARSAYPLLRDGAPQLNAIPCDDPQVLCVLRRHAGGVLLGLIKIGARKRTATFSLPVDQIDLPDAEFLLRDLISGQVLQEQGRLTWRRDDLLSFQLTLEPFEAYALLIEQVDQLAAGAVPQGRAIARPRQPRRVSVGGEHEVAEIEEDG
ncbi:MAG: hypothetical protein H7Z42_12000, partial [Roseiflexaceae bacterium]|nr:hypothetical protein [Roseiflexaceae bacterium]